MSKLEGARRDRLRTERRYSKSIKQLEGCLKLHNSIGYRNWIDLSKVDPNDQIRSLREALDHDLEARQGVGHQQRSSLKRILIALLPLSENCLTIAADSVRPPNSAR